MSNSNNKQAMQHIEKALELIEALKNTKLNNSIVNNTKSALELPAFLQIQAG